MMHDRAEKRALSMVCSIQKDGWMKASEKIMTYTPRKGDEVPILSPFSGKTSV
jgi:hypothetical protein